MMWDLPPTQRLLLGTLYALNAREGGVDNSEIAHTQNHFGGLEVTLDSVRRTLGRLARHGLIDCLPYTAGNSKRWHVLYHQEGQKPCFPRFEYFWVSWYSLHQSFMLFFPWWRTGQQEADGAAIYCAAIAAPDEETARQIVISCFDTPPTVFKFRFLERRPAGWTPFCDRFQRRSWMVWPAEMEVK